MLPSPPTSSAVVNNPNSVLPALHHALSGSLGTLISTCSLYPLSLVIARLQVQRQLHRRRGPLGPAQAPDPEPAPPARGPPGLSVPHPTTPVPTSPPLLGDRPPRERADTRIPVLDQDQRPPQRTVKNVGIVDVCSQIWSSDGDGGLKAFYIGLAQDAPKSALDSFLFFLFYKWFRSLRLRSHRRAGRVNGRGLGVIEELVIGMAAGACSRGFTTPIANVVTRKQTATLLDPDNALGVRGTVRSIREEKGMTGFWFGYSASLVLTLNPSLTFFFQEFLQTAFAQRTCDDLDPRLNFLFAATSKAISSAITYPFQIAKTRLQAGLLSEPDVPDEKEPTETYEVNSKPDKYDDDVGDAEKKVRKSREAVGSVVQNLARQNIFGTIARIIQAEGIGSLYDGIGAELLKGFFGHGITMVVKDVVHKLLFKLYIAAVGVLGELLRRGTKISMPQAALLRILRDGVHRTGRRRIK